MADVVIHHCTLRVRRRNGWSWGSEPRGLLEAAMRSLPELLAQHLASLWPDDAAFEISTPLRIRIPMGLNELGTVPRIALGGLPFETNAHYADLGRRIEAAINATLSAAQVISADAITTETDLASEPESAISNASDPGWAGSPLLLLLKWQAQGLLETHLAAFSHASLDAWHRHLFRITAPVQPREAEALTAAQALTDVKTLTATVNTLVRELAQKIPHTTLNQTSILRRRLIMGVNVAAKLKLPAIKEIVRRAIDEVLPLSSPDAPAFGNVESLSDEPITRTRKSNQIREAVDIIPSPQPLKINAASLPANVVETEFRISSALPFLLLGPLSRVGYLETLAATLETAGLTKQSPAFALALGHKVLEPPARGWQRDSACLAAATAFAGLAVAPPESALVEFAGNIAAHLSPLESILRDCLTEGHRPGQPLLLHQTVIPIGLLLMDVEGSFPVAWSSKLESLLPTLRSFGTSVCLIPRASAEPELLARLDAEGCCFLTDGPPARGERWRALRRGNQSWWTNDQTASQNTLLSSARLLSRSQESAAELWREFDTQRPSVPLSDDATLDRHLTLAASVALGTIAWTLWHEQEATTPQLALTRFRSLDARVRFDRDTVRVFLPRGRRYQDLLEHRLLDDIFCVPWFGERSLQFAGG